MYTHTHTYTQGYLGMYIERQETNLSRLKYECMNLTKNTVLGRTYNIRSNLRDKYR